MTEFKITLNNTCGKGYGIEVKKCDSRKDGLIIVSIDADSEANNKNLKVGDKIIRINNKSTENSRNKLISELHDSKFDYVILTIKRSLMDLRHQSDNYLSSSVSSLNASFQSTFRNSKSSIDLKCSYQTLSKILDSNYVTENHINEFFQDVSNTLIDTSISSPQRNEKSNISLEDSDSNPGSRKQSTCVPPSPSNVQLTMKKAYKKSIDETETIYQSQQPKINRKKATNILNNSKESVPVVTVKRRTNQLYDNNSFAFRNSPTNRNMKPYSPSPCPKSLSIIPSSLSNSSLATQMESPVSIQPTYQTYESVDGSIHSRHKPILVKETTSLKEINSLLTSIECEMKILSFLDEKIAKPTWKKYWMEIDFSGVHFQCSDLSQSQVSSNSTALNPSIANPELIMNVWDINNNITKFYLPIFQPKYDEQIIRSTTLEEMKISFLKKLEFSIKLTEENSANLCKMLKAPLPEIKIPPIKHKKSVASLENPRPEPRKFKQISKPITEKLILSSLPQSPKVEGIPLFVVLCATLIEEFGIEMLGIYRKSGNLPDKRILEEVIMNENPEKWSSYDEWFNVHTVASLLKSTLRKYTLLDKDMAIKLSTIKLDIDESMKADVDRKLQDIMDMIYHLNFNFKSAISAEEIKCRFDTFKYIIKHLYRMQLWQEHTKMNAENLAMCFVPNLIENIPVDDVIQIKESRAIVAHENLTKMVAFWITNADIMCELLEEQKEEELPKKITDFLNQKCFNNNYCTMTNNNIKSESEIQNLVKERIEYYTENVNTSKVDNRQKSPESYFSRTKNSRMYQSVKQPRAVKNRRRNNSGSSIDLLKPADLSDGPIITQKDDLKTQTGSPIVQRFTGKNWKKTKEQQLGLGPIIKMTTLSMSGVKKDVPLIVTACVDIIENSGLRVDGIYRISGRNQDINQLNLLIMKDNTDKWTEENNIKIWANMHNTACLLKKMLKKFCLIPKETWMHMTSQFSEKLEPEDVKNVLKTAAYHMRLEQTKLNIYYSQSRINCDDSGDIKYLESLIRSGTLRYVLKHLKHISLHESENRMSSNSLAVCFVPVLMEEDYSSNMVVINTKCIQIVQLLIDHCDWIFKWDFKPSEEIYGQKMSDNLETHLKEYKPIPCQCDKGKDSNYIANQDEIKVRLEGIIKLNYQLEEFEINDLITLLENKKLANSTKLKKN